MNRLLRLVLLSLSLQLTACAVGPLVSHESARTIAPGHHEMIGGYGAAGLVFKWTSSVGKNWDVGLQWESLSLGVRAKYAFLNSSAGWSLASAFGAGLSIGGRHLYGDLIASYLSGKLEPYATFRAVGVKTDPLELRDEDTGHVDFRVNSSTYYYGQAMLGSRFWLNDRAFLSAELSSLFPLSSDLKIHGNLLIGAAVGYRF